ncbi:AAA family ATPase [Mucilaginibacter myungsuensis]|uniref:AAA family ATPase n=1 Tax=Mucilaginibacter myungsuensis TaxID=649104 RepID=A0A929KZ62_9SPHI|nr:AAA family ATPase [Mucilaginibacter myungsuensis]MBE9664389.1 AAA family ATPase [Mucilaginibacter myungsuensis]MDN3597100.1 AAA family ATPase [Mucilaginibacter myungsuensis]
MDGLRPLEIEMIRADVRKANEKITKQGSQKYSYEWGEHGQGLFRTKRAHDWLIEERGKPKAEQLFGALWYEGELCIMFADTNLGKSVLAVQIGDAISKGHHIGPFHNFLQRPAAVLYIDFELSTRQFEARYTKHNYGMHQFADRFYRAEFLPGSFHPQFNKDYEGYVERSIEKALNKTKAKILIIDNITYMSSGTEKANDALALMKSLKALKEKHGLSILVLAHTPKRNAGRPLTVNDLQGSKMLINFADSAFAIGQSLLQPQKRYLKQIKQRNGTEQYGEDNICLMTLVKPYGFLYYQFADEDYGRERDHLRLHAATTPQVQQQILTLHQEGSSLRKIAAELNIHFTTVAKVVRVMKGSEEVTKTQT